MGQYDLPPDKIHQIDVYHTTGYGEYASTYTTKMTDQEWNALTEDEKKSYWLQYAGDPGSPKDHPVQRKETPDDSPWKYEAQKGYDVDPKTLRDLADKMEGEMNGWKSKLNRVQTINITTQNVTDYQAGKDFVDIATTSKTAFGQYITDITSTWNAVIGRLRATATEYERAHHKTKDAVDKDVDL
ncbi:hypothetical protein [Actinomadura gamaensis]|uniref:WXG100 family type VII secretion target n=1 Tax=Actinomadura gamaensis TaxID=1763541 RepID=A0ABV9U9Q4_9ACTN